MVTNTARSKPTHCLTLSLTCDVKVFALVEMHAYILAEKKEKKLASNYGEM